MTLHNSPERLGINSPSHPSDFDHMGTTRNLFEGDHLSEEGREGLANYLKMKQELDETIKDLDVKLNRVLAKQEYEYLQGYNVYVKQKEKELKETINQLSERYNNQGAKDTKLLTLQKAIKGIREEQIKMDRDNIGLKTQVKTLRASV